MQFKKYRESKRIGPIEAAKQLGVTYQAVHSWESGGSVPRDTMQLKIQDWSGGAVTPEDWKIAAQNCSAGRNGGHA